MVVLRSFVRARGCIFFRLNFHLVSVLLVLTFQRSQLDTLFLLEGEDH